VPGESATMTFEFANDGALPVTLPDPERSVAWSKVIVRAPDGSEHAWATRDLEKELVHAPMPLPPAPDVTLAPGQRLVVERELLHWVRLPEPGRYTLTLVTASSLGEVRSAPVALEVVPLMLAHVADS